MKIVIIGDGLMGLSSAIALLENGLATNVSILSLPSHYPRCSQGCGALWRPVFVSGTDQGLLKQWATDTFEHLWSLLKPENSELALGAAHEKESKKVKPGIAVCSGYELLGEATEDPWWKDIVFGFRRVSQKELSQFPIATQVPSPVNDAWFFTSLMIDPTWYLPWLRAKFEALGGSFIPISKELEDIRTGFTYMKKEEVKQVSQGADEAVVVVNCTGMGASTLVPDPDLRPVRGQTVKVADTSVKHFVALLSEENFAYVLPRETELVLGGTSTASFDDSNNEQEIEAIRKRCQTIFSQLTAREDKGEAVDEKEKEDAAVPCEAWAGLRPVRDTGVRVELEQVDENQFVVHNYGHGGSGMTLHWGCALHVVSLIQQLHVG